VKLNLSATVVNTFLASIMTSGPMPSPANTAMFDIFSTYINIQILNFALKTKHRLWLLFSALLSLQLSARDECCLSNESMLGLMLQ